MDPIAEWQAAQRRVTELMSDIDDEQAAQTVAACPGWTVRELLSHMIGLDADVLAGDEPDDHNDAWTQRQVDTRQGRTVAQLLAEWDELTGPLSDWMAANNPRPLGDAIIHEQDLRGTLGRPGGRDTDGLASIRDRMLDRFAANLDSLPPIALVAADWTWASGDDPAVEVHADRFDLTRAVLSRRSAGQLRSWTAVGDIEPYLTAFEVLGPLPDHDLVE